jgi:G3E family GTPase
MIPFYLVTGFLGSGKTTLLKRILNDYADNKKIGVIQNEFAPGNVDGIDLKETGKSFEILEINKGSVFCVCLLADFIHSLRDFINQEKPDILILEASGLADPVAIGELLMAPELNDQLFLAHIWCIVDASKFLQIEPKMTRITHQVRIADSVIINKTDLDGDREAIQQRIHTLNPYAGVMTAAYCDIPFQQVLDNYTSEPLAVRRRQEFSGIEPGGRPNIHSAVIRTNKKISEEQLNRFLEEYIPNTYRIKGYIRLSDGTVKAIQTAFDTCNIENISNYSGNTEIIAMGENIEPRKMRNRLVKS